MADQRGIFITFEGGEGSGKSTQIKRLQDFLASQNIAHIITREPGGTPSSEPIRSLLLGKTPWLPVTEALLMSASRAQHLYEKIVPALSRGEWVICDRFADSTWVYQGVGHGLDLEQIERLNTWVTGALTPDVTFVFQLAAQTGLLRKQHQSTEENRFEAKGAAFHERVEVGYQRLLKAHPDRCIPVDATQSVADIASFIQGVLVKRFLTASQRV